MEKTNKIQYIDGLKGVGALMVMLSHYNLMRFPAPTWFHDGYFSTLFMSGGFAVALFLIVSGFTAWMSVERKINDRKLIGKMIVNRYFRFGIPFGVVFIIMYACWYLGIFNWHIDAGELTKSEVLKTAFWPVNIVGFIKSLLLSPINSDFWDSPLWMMKYVFLGTYIAILLRLGVSTISSTYRFLIILFTSLVLSIFDVFFMGIMLGICFSYLYHESNFVYQSKWIGGALFIFFLTLRWSFPIGISVESKNFFTASICLVSIYLLPTLQNILQHPVFQYLGKISFSIFIFHWPILGSLTSFVYIQTYNLPFVVSSSLCFGITLVAVIVISHFFEKYIEKGLSDIIIKKIGNHIFNDGNKLT